MKDLGANLKRTVFDGVLVAFVGLALLVAIYSPSEEALLDLRSNGLYFLLFVLVGGLFSWLANSFGHNTLGELLFAPDHRKAPSALHIPWYKTVWGIETVVVLIMILIVGWNVVDVSVVRLLEKESFDHAMRLFAELLNPDWSILPKAILKVIESVLIAFMATVIAVPVAFLLCFLCARNIMSRVPGGIAIYTILRLYFNISRSVEPVLWAIIFSIWVGFGPFAGMLALMIHSIASLAKQYSELVECVEQGPIEGIESTGANFVQTIWFAIVPQVVLPFISYTIYRWDINVRMATIIGFVGGGGIGVMLLAYQGQAQWPQVGCIIFTIAFVVWVMDSFSAYVREALK